MSFLCLFVLFSLSTIGRLDDAHHREGIHFTLSLLIQMLISSRDPLTDTHRNAVLAAVWASLRLVVLTHKINHHSEGYGREIYFGNFTLYACGSRKKPRKAVVSSSSWACSQKEKPQVESREPGHTGAHIFLSLRLTLKTWGDLQKTPYPCPWSYICSWFRKDRGPKAAPHGVHHPDIPSATLLVLSYPGLTHLVDD